MTKDQRFEFRRVTTHLRPPRIAVLLNDEIEYWERACLSILEWSTRVWGGRYVPIIPTDGQTIADPFWRALEAFDPDLIYRYELEGRDIEDANPEQYSTIVDEAVQQAVDEDDPSSERDRTLFKEELRRFRFGSLEISESLRSEIRRRLNPFHREERIIRAFRGRNGAIGHRLTDVTNVVSASDFQKIMPRDFSSLSTEMQLMAGAEIGSISEALLDGLKEANIEPEVQKVNPTDFAPLMREVWEQGERNNTLLHSLTNLHCSSAYRTDIPRFEEPVVLVVGSSLEDYCFYQTLSSIKAHTFWAPESMLNNGADQGEANSTLVGLRGHLARDICAPSSMYRQRRNIGSRIRFVSQSSSPGELEKVAEIIRDDILLPDYQKEFAENAEISEGIDGLFRYRRRVFENGNVDHRSMMQYDRGTSVERVDTPKPMQFEEVSVGGLSWITDLEIEDYHLPQVAEFAPDTLEISWYDTDWVRVTRRGFSYHCPHHTHFGGQTLDQILPRPTLHLQSALDIVKTLFAAEDYYVELSDKGNFQEQASSRVGSREKLNDLLRREEFRQLLNHYASIESSTEEEGFVYIQQNGRVYASYAGIDRMVEDEPIDFIDDLVELGILHRGIILLCQFCRNSDWYGLSDLSQMFTCSRCHQEQQIQRKHWKMPPNGPKWYFELDEIVYQFFTHNTHVTTLALQTLEEDSTSFICVPEIEIYVDDGDNDGPENEIDICAIVDGELTIGEASISANKGRNEVDDYLALAEEVGASTIVFATFAEGWTPDLKEYAAEQSQDKRCDFIFLAQDTLL